MVNSEQPTTKLCVTFRSTICVRSITGPPENGQRGVLMDITRLLSDLRSEPQDIEQAILSLERLGRRSSVPAKLAFQSEAEVRIVEPDDVS